MNKKQKAIRNIQIRTNESLINIDSGNHNKDIALFIKAQIISARIAMISAVSAIRKSK